MVLARPDLNTIHKKDKRVGTFKQTVLFRISAEHWTGKYIHIAVLVFKLLRSHWLGHQMGLLSFQCLHNSSFTTVSS
jgi:hypothetical protein